MQLFLQSLLSHVLYHHYQNHNFKSQVETCFCLPVPEQQTQGIHIQFLLRRAAHYKLINHAVSMETVDHWMDAPTHHPFLKLKQDLWTMNFLSPSQNQIMKALCVVSTQTKTVKSLVFLQNDTSQSQCFFFFKYLNCKTSVIDRTVQLVY